MNLELLKRNVGNLVQLEPPAYDSGGQPAKDDWSIESVDTAGVMIQNERLGSKTILAPDHIHHYTSDPARTEGTQSYGHLTLLVQLYVDEEGGVSIRPTLRPGEALPQLTLMESRKWVDLGYPQDAGISKELDEKGYRLRWFAESRATRAIEFQGWELVVVRSDGGGRVTLWVRDNPEAAVLLKTQLPDVEILVSRANARLRGRPGFIGASVYSENPPVIEYRFADPASAIGFQMERANSAPALKYERLEKRLDTILEYHPI